MRIDHLELINFKNFEHLVADFGPGVNLFVGVNGAGKTAILEALCVACGAFFGSRNESYQRRVELNEIRIHDRRRLDGTSVRAKMTETPPLEWVRIRNSTGRRASSEIAPASEFGNRFFRAFDQNDAAVIAPVIAYYSTQRLFKVSQQSRNQRYDPLSGRYNGYLNCLDVNSISSVLLGWLKNSVVNRTTNQVTGGFQGDPVLENVEKSIKFTLTHFLGLTENDRLRIFPDANFEDELFMQIGEDQPLPLSYLSDGLRNLVFLVLDMTWRCAQLNPLLDFETLRSQSFGTVMIDEIDLHLHPKWQGKAVPLLQNLFPKIQFFITTHSPQVVANFKDGILFTITNNEVQRVGEAYYGKEVAAITRQLMGAPLRNEDVQIKINTLLSQIDQGTLSPEDIDQELEAIASWTGLNDREVLAIQAILDWKRYQSENDAVHQEG